MATCRITKAVVGRLQPGEVAWDDQLKGFGVRRQKQARSFVLKYRHDGRQRIYTIGRYGSPWSVDMARREALRLLGKVVGGSDPAEEKRRQKSDVTIAELCKIYVDTGCSTKKEATLRWDQSRIKRHIVPTIGAIRLRALDRSDVLRMQRDIKDGKTAVDERTRKQGRAIVKGGPGASNKCVALLSAMLSFAVEQGLRDDNPALGIKKYPGKPQERFLTQVEIGRLGQALKELHATGHNGFALAAIELLLLTGCRKSEVLSLRWSEVDIGRRMLMLEDSKTGPKPVHLGNSAVKHLKELPRVRDCEFVFPSSSASGHIVDVSKTWNALREKADLHGVRLHDLRHTFASIGAASGTSLYILGKALGHRHAATTQRYAHLADQAVQDASEQISSRIARLMSSTP